MRFTLCKAQESRGDDSSSTSLANALEANPCILKTYVKPVLIVYGDVRDITLGGSQNPGDPGAPGSPRRNF